MPQNFENIPEFSLKESVKLVVAIEAAGFKIRDNKSTTPSSESEWEATLAHGRTKIVTVFNDGHGGDEYADYHATDPSKRGINNALLTSFFAIPEVAKVARDHAIYMLGLKRRWGGMTPPEFDQRKAQVLQDQPLPTEDNVTNLVATLATADLRTKQIRRSLRTSIAFVKKGDDAKFEYQTFKAADTPAAREAIQKRYNLCVDYFLADLFHEPVKAERK